MFEFFVIVLISIFGRIYQLKILFLIIPTPFYDFQRININ